MSTLPQDVNAVNGEATSVDRASDSGSARPTYRHGDLRNALIEAGLRLAAGEGPNGVVLREATRQAGVSPNAAYRHFRDRDDLLVAVSERCLAFVASEITKELAEAASPDDVGARLDAVGRAYVRFALREPGLFRTAFSVHRDARAGRGSEAGGPGPLGLLLQVLDDGVATGAIPAERRPGAEVAAWSAVHGLAVLLLDGPLRSVPPEAHEALIERTVPTVRDGLLAPRSGA